jgi:purine-binding chemotaxis protein CheW
MLVKEISKTVEITRVPRASDLIIGIVSLRGTILPILNLGRKLGLQETPLDRQTRIVVVSSESGLVGLLVDAVTGVFKMSESEIKPPPVALSDVEIKYIKGVGRYKERLIVFMDLAQILRYGAATSNVTVGG